MADDDLVPRPPELERDVQFWIRVYTEVNTDSGFLHDERNLAVVYETLRFAPEDAVARAPARGRSKRDYLHRRACAGSRPRRRAAVGRRPADPQSVGRGCHAGRAARGDPITSAFSSARRTGSARASSARASWQAHIAETFASQGLPPQLAVLPHVESSFNPAAYSKVGAAGLWQFMRSTGRRYMRIDNSVDERLDPFRSTEAAAQLLSYNYRLLGTWPLALTAYNHGAAGMRRAKEAMGTDDIVKIVRQHKSPSFGFASRNFYVSFLAALEIDSHPDKYFSDLKRASEMKFQEVTLPATQPSAELLARIVKVDREELRELNPGMRPPVWQGQRQVPKGYRLRLPAGGGRLDLGAARQATRRRSAGARGCGSTRNAATAPQQSQPPPTSTPRRRRPPRRRHRPSPPPRQSRAAKQPPAAGAVPTVAAQIESAQDAKAVAVVGKPATRAEPVTAAQAEELGPSLGPAIETPQSADPIDYSIAANDTIAVAAEETLGHYAEWLGTSAARLRQINKMKFRQPVLIGRHIKLEFDKIGRDDFEQQRREYHRVLQASYFAAHRIIGTDVYTVRRGESLWTVRQSSGELPVWLLQQYNPDVDIGEMRAGVEIVVPKVEEVAASG